MQFCAKYYGCNIGRPLSAILIDVTDTDMRPIMPLSADTDNGKDTSLPFYGKRKKFTESGITIRNTRKIEKTKKSTRKNKIYDKILVFYTKMLQ